MPLSVSVVIGSFNRLPFLKDTLASVRAEVKGIREELIVVDGGSSDGTLPWLVRQKDVITVVQHNRGTSRGKPIERRSWGYFMNLGFKAATGRFVCMLSDDCLVVPGAIRNGLELFEHRLAQGDKVGAVAFYFRDWPGESRYRVGRTWGNQMFVNHGLYLKEALQQVGYIDEDAYRFYHADGDLVLRMSEAGYECIDSPESFVEHYPHANTTVRASNMAIQKADWKTYTDTWGSLGEPTEAWSKRDFTDPESTAKKYWSWKDRRMRWRRRLGRSR
jgi:GT2 family glycosyltransferase